MSEIKVHPLRKAREKYGVTQKALGELTGLGSATIGRAERGEPLSPYSITQICEYFSMRYNRQVEPQELRLRMKWEDDKELYDSREKNLGEQEKVPQPMQKNIQEGPGTIVLSDVVQEITTQSPDNSFTVLTKEQVTFFLKILGENAMPSSPSRRKLLQDLLTGAGLVATMSTLDSLDVDSRNQLSQATIDPTDINERELNKFEKITANCWLLLKFDGLPTVDQLLPTYLPKIATFALQQSRYQERAASIAAQGFILAGLASVLNSRIVESERFCKQAVTYARIAKDRNLEAAALKHLATKFLDNGHPKDTLHTYQEVLPFISEISPLLQGRTHLGLALAYARTQQKKEALYYLDLAQDTFPEHPETDLAFSYADCGTSSLYHYGGLVRAEFDQFEKARDTFTQVEGLSSKTGIPERTRIEIINCQVESSLALKDSKVSRDLIEMSIMGALKLESEKRYHDALSLYKQARIIWPDDQQIRDLADLLLR